MTMKTSYAKRIIAFAVAVILLLGTLFTGVVTVSAAVTDGITGNALASTSLNGVKSPTGNASVADITGGGITYSTNAQDGALSPYVHGKLATNCAVSTENTFPGNGFSLQFDGLTFADTYSANKNYQQFVVVLGTGNIAAKYRLAKDIPGILIDTKLGKLSLVEGTSTSVNAYTVICDIVTNDALKYANLSGKAFTLDIAENDIDGVNIGLTVDGTCYAGTVSSASWSQITTQKRTYFSIGAAPTIDGSTATSTMSVNYYGYRQGVTVNVQDNSEPDCTANLTDIASADENNLKAKADEVDYVKIGAAHENGGVKLVFTSGSAYYPYAYTQNLVATTGGFVGSGILLQFANYKNNNTDATVKGNGIVAIGLSNGVATTTVRENTPFLELDTNKGTLKLKHSKDNSVSETVSDWTIIMDARLKAGNISGKEFSIAITERADGDYIVAVDIAGDAFAGILPDEKLSAFATAPTDTAAYISVGGTDISATSNNSWSINFYGYKVLDNTYVTPTITEVPPPSVLLDNISGIATSETDLVPTETDKAVTDLNGGGVSLYWASKSAGAPYRYTANLGSRSTSGFELRFDNYVIDASTDSAVNGYGQLAVALSSTTASDGTKIITNDVPYLVLDTVNGTLTLKYCKNGAAETLEEVIAANDTLKYANITGKPFKLIVKEKEDGTGYDVAVNVDGTEVAGTFSAINFAKAALGLTKLQQYVSVGGTDNDAANANKWSVEFYGYRSVAPSQADFIPTLDDVATKAKDRYATSDIKKVVEDFENGGVVVHWDANSGTFPYSYKTNIGNFYDTGFTLYFDNYIIDDDAGKTRADYGQLLFIMSKTESQDQTKTKKDVPFLQLDTVNGTVKLRYCKDISFGTVDGWADVEDVIAANDKLKYANIKGKPFTLTIKPQDDSDNFDVIFNIDGDEVAGVMSADMFNAIANHPTNSVTYISIGSIFAGNENDALKYNKWGIEFYGYKKIIPPPSPLLNGLTGIATTLTDIETRNLRTVTDLNGGGVSITYTQGISGYAPYRYTENLGGFPGDGIMLQFDDYAIDAGTSSEYFGYGQIVICVSSTTAGECTKIKKEVPFLQIDTINGNVTLRYCKDISFGTTFDPVSEGFETVDTIIENSETLKYANIKGKPFKVLFEKAENNFDYKVTIDVNGTAVSGIMEADKYNAIKYAANPLNTYISVGGIDNDGVNNPNNWSIKFFGHKAVEILPPVVDVSELTEIVDSTSTLYPATSYKKLEDLAVGGVKITYLNSYSGYHPYTFSSSIGTFPGPGYKFLFSNYINASVTRNEYYGQIVFIMSNSSGNDNAKIKLDVPFLQIDTVNGDLLLRHCNDVSFGNEQGFSTDQVIIDNCDLLKYSNFSRKVFTIAFAKSATSQGDVDVTIEVFTDGHDKPGQSVTGVLDMDIFNALQYAANTTWFFSVGGFDNSADIQNPWSMEFYGFQNLGVHKEDVVIKAQTVDEVISAIAALTTATNETSNDILVAKAKYDTLSADDKALVTNVDKLNTLIAELNALRQSTKIKPTSTYIAREPDPSLPKAQFSNPHARTLFSFEKDNGFRVEWRGASGIIASYAALASQSIYGAYKLDGLRVFIENFDFDATKGSDFWFNFSGGKYAEYSDCWDGTAEMARHVISVRVGLTKNKLELNGVGFENAWIAGKSDILLRDNMKGKNVIVEWNKQTDGGYICTITVGEEVVAFKLAADKLAAMSDFDENSVRVIIGTANVKNVFSMDVTGIYSGIDAASQSVIDQLERLPATISSAKQLATAESVLAAYEALTLAQKNQVYNVKLVTLLRANIRKYKGINEEGYDTDGYYIPSKRLDLYGDSQKESVYVWAEDSKYGGVHYDFNNGGYGLKNCFNKYFVIDGISVRFDNFNYGNDGAIVVGFENSSQECKVFDMKAGDTRNGIWLIIGRDNTIYTTNAYYDVTGCYPLFEENELLSSANLVNKEFFISWIVNYKDDGSVTLTMTFTVDGVDFTYTYEKDYVDRLDLMDIEDIQVVTHCISGMNPGDIKTYGTHFKQQKLSGVSIDITGIKYEKFSTAQKNAIQEVIDAIDTLPDKASYDIEDDVYDIWKMYYALSFKEMRLGVTNHSKLIDLYSQLFDMRLADGTMYLVEEEEDEEDEEWEDEEWEDEEDWYVGEDEEYEDDWYEDEEYEDDFVENDPDDESEDDEEKKPVKVVKKKKVKKNASNDWIIFVIIGGVVVLAAAAMVIIILVRKRKGKEGK